MNGWTPNPNDLRQILELLHSSQTADNEVQRQVQEKLQQLNQYPDFHYYLGQGSEFAYNFLTSDSFNATYTLDL